VSSNFFTFAFFAIKAAASAVKCVVLKLLCFLRKELSHISISEFLEKSIILFKFVFPISEV